MTLGDRTGGEVVRQLGPALLLWQQRDRSHADGRIDVVRAFVIVFAAAAAALVGIALAGEPAPQREPSWTTSTDVAHGFTLSLPPGWQRAPESLTPRLTEPRERFSAGTFSLRYVKGDCNHVPDGALRALGPRDAFVTLLERGRGAESTEFEPRPRRFASVAAADRQGDSIICGRDTTGRIEFWMPFRDAGRSFYALVVLGRDAPDGIRDQAFAVLDRLRFDPDVRPGWPASP
jgi:hypothetical protein